MKKDILITVVTVFVLGLLAGAAVVFGVAWLAE